MFPSSNEDKKIFEGFNQGKKIIYQIYIEPSKSLSLRQAKKFLRKLQIPLETQFTPIGIDFPNLKALRAQLLTYSAYLPRPIIGYLIVGSDGILQYYFRIEILQEELENHKEIIYKLISSIETIFEWSKICCSICMKQIRYSKRTSTTCIDYVTENPCYQYLKNTKMNYEKCK
ncbi:MAG: hypothetical protein N3A69_05245 [Leptospiraceae bacterium]|nr:hypothetical protein [Leptospiraceae bacterium]